MTRTPTALAALAAPVLIMTLFSLWRLAPTVLAAPVLTMTSFSLWSHSLLSWPRQPLRTYVRTDTLPRLKYKDAKRYYLLISYHFY